MGKPRENDGLMGFMGYLLGFLGDLIGFIVFFYANLWDFKAINYQHIRRTRSIRGIVMLAY